MKKIKDMFSIVTLKQHIEEEKLQFIDYLLLKHMLYCYMYAGGE